MAKRKNDAAVLAGERQAGRWAAAAGLGSLVATVASVVVGNAASAGTGLSAGPTGSGGEDDDRLRALVDFHEHVGLMAASTALRALSLLLMVVVGLYVIRLVRTRDARQVQPWLPALTWAAPIVLCAMLAVGFVASADVASTLTGDGAATAERAKQLVDDSVGLAVADVGGVLLRVPMAFWVAFLAIAAMRVGLLTRFLGYWGVAAGVCLVLLAGSGDALLVGWIGSVGVLASGYWPGGRPAAWDSTRPEPIEAI
ncbi:unannotated protein [freshwater metagenome]|uniref:Unannotated protein n=1 Tax=freshwater metagenome TaxID=449393 RepID=A0A6J7H680_9ZZZZ|nr:DUF4386 family protein [Actinomycetota bacterium]